MGICGYKIGISLRYTPIFHRPNTLLPSSRWSSGNNGEKVLGINRNKKDNMKPKNGKQPPKSETVINRDEVIKIRVTAFEKYALQAKANSTGLNLSDYLRKCGLGRALPVLPSTEEVQAYIQLKSLESNFQRISNMYKHKNEAELKLEIQNTIALLQEHIKKIKYGK